VLNAGGREEEAIELLRRGVKYTPWEPATRACLGRAHSRRGEFDAAISAYDALIRFSPRLAIAYYNRGNARTAKGQMLARAGRVQEAKAEIEAAIPDLFRAVAVPGVLLIAAVAALGVVEARRARVPRQGFAAKEAGAALWRAKWEVLLPVVAIVCMFGGFCTLIEAAALTVAYALFIQLVVHREVHPTRDLPRVLARSVTLVGGVIAILGIAMGLTNDLIFSEVPTKAAEWVQANVHSKFMFLLALNLFLIVVGALMDIYSAIMVVVPLILPASAAFGIHELHMGAIFLANLELGYLVPPVGENLFLASYRFDKPVMRIAAAVAPFVIAILIAVLAVTYIPGMTMWAAPAPPAGP